MRRIVFLLVVLVCSAAVFGQDATQGSLFASSKGKDLGACPLKTTSVTADISGFLARVTVRQEFENSFTTPIEAVYVFPLSQKAAVDQMTMTVGTRVIRGKIMRREEARQTYETAKSEGKTAALLDQERANIFTQSVANIMPGESVIVEISYVETLKYEEGSYEFVFPMTVAPRYIPPGVRDAARISPPVARFRSGHDISIAVNLNAGVPVESIRSSSHAIDQTNLSPSTARIELREGKVIPNKDFILRYDVTGKRIEDAVLVHRDESGGFFTMILQPPDKIATEDRTPKEIVFVLDTSGSMEGFPIEKAKEAMKLSLDGLYPEDTFNLITFAGDTSILFERPVPATQANLERAQAFLATRNGYGGTEMMTAIKAALAPSDAQGHLRIVCFMTDGEVGNDDEIVAEVQRHPNARVFSFGIGSSVNRSLLDRIALEGRGEAEYVALADDGSKAARKFYERVRTPLLTDLSIDWSNLPVADVYPTRLTDLFSAKPVVVHGRFTGAANGQIKLKGKVAGQAYERQIAFNLPESEAANDVLATLWARTRIDDITSQRLKTDDEKTGADLDNQITNLGLEFGLLTNFTSFVAVEDRIVNQNGTPTRVEVPIERPEGTKEGSDSDNSGFVAEYGGATGGIVSKQSKSKARRGQRRSAKKPLKNDVAYVVTGTGSGTGSGTASGSGAGTVNVVTRSGVASASPSAPPPPNTGVQAVVDVTSESVSIDATSSKVVTAVSSQNVELLPRGNNFDSLLKVSPTTRAKPRGGTFQIDGASGSENTFVIDGLSAGSSGTTQLEGRTTVVLQPEYPSRVRAAAVVRVDINVDTLGNVVSVKASGASGAAFRAAAEEAARGTKFEPTYNDGKAVRLAGALIYRFTRARKVDIALGAMKAVPPTEKEMRLARLNEKLHFWVATLLIRLSVGGEQPAANEELYVRDGNAELEVELRERSTATLEKIKGVGFVVTREKGKSSVIGAIAITKIADLATIEEVKLVIPKI